MMSDLISRQAAIAAIFECCPSDYDSEYECGYDDGLKQGIHRLKHLPTIDAVPVIRCRDCKYYWKNNSKYKSNMEDLDDLMMCLASPRDDAFCSEGEKA